MIHFLKNFEFFEDARCYLLKANHVDNVDNVRRPIRDNPKIFFKSEELKNSNPKTMFQIAVVFGNHFQTIFKTIRNLNKTIGSTNTFLQI